MHIEAFGKEFELGNEDKVERAIHGTIGRGGTPQGGVGEEATPEAIIAEYDRLAGRISMDGDKVASGCFWDFKARAAVNKPEVKLQFKINGHLVEVLADEPLPALVRAAKQVEQGLAPTGEEDEAPAPAKATSLIGSKRTTKAKAK